MSSHSMTRRAAIHMIKSTLHCAGRVQELLPMISGSQSQCSHLTHGNPKAAHPPEHTIPAKNAQLNSIDIAPILLLSSSSSRWPFSPRNSLEGQIRAVRGARVAHPLILFPLTPSRNSLPPNCCPSTLHCSRRCSPSIPASVELSSQIFDQHPRKTAVPTLYACYGIPKERRANFGFVLVSGHARISIAVEVMVSLHAASLSASCPS